MTVETGTGEMWRGAKKDRPPENEVKKVYTQEALARMQREAEIEARHARAEADRKFNEAQIEKWKAENAANTHKAEIALKTETNEIQKAIEHEITRQMIIEIGSWVIGALIIIIFAKLFLDDRDKRQREQIELELLRREARLKHKDDDIFS